MTEHILWQCPSANDVWGEDSIKLQKRGREVGSFLEIFEDMINRCNKEELDLFGIIVRKIWLRRNTWLHEGSFEHPTTLLRNTKKELEEFQEANSRALGGNREDSTRQAALWKPPPSNFIKINWDATTSKENKRSGLGLIARDHKGNCLAACSLLYGMIIEPVVADAFVALHAMMIAKELGYVNV